MHGLFLDAISLLTVQQLIYVGPHEHKHKLEIQKSLTVSKRDT